MKTIRMSTASFGALFLGAAGIATAHPEHDSKSPIPISFEPSIVGHIGLDGGLNFAKEVDGLNGFTDKASVPFSGLNLSITLPKRNNFLMTVDGDFRWDGFKNSGDFTENEDPFWQYNVGFHVLKQFNDDSRAGVFVNYGATQNQGDVHTDDNERAKRPNYDVLMGGFEAHHFLYDDLMLYTQVGYGQKLREGDSGERQTEGFAGGLVSRWGATYFMSETSSFNVDLEFSTTYNYIDSSDPGRFFGTTLTYKTQPWEDSPMIMSLFGRMDHISSTDEGDSVEEWQLGFGMKYYYGAGSQMEAARKGASLGMPRLPTRASAWTEWID